MKYLVDTNVLLSYPEFVNLPGIEIVLTYKVICELDNKKYEPGTLGLASRTVSKWLDAARTNGDLAAGVLTEKENVVRVVLDADLDMKTDDALVEVAYQMVNGQTSGGDAISDWTGEDKDIVLLSNDINVRVKGALYGLAVDGWGKSKNENVNYQCLPEILVPDEVIQKIYTTGVEVEPEWELVRNSYYMFKSEINEKRTAVCFYDGDELRKVLGKKKIFGLMHRNVDQMCAIDALMKPEIPLVTLIGKAGSGKTLLAIAAGLDAVLEKKAEGKMTCEKLLIIRPPIPMGTDVGYLPGDLAAKLSGYAGSITDNLDALCGGQKNVEHLFANGTIEIVPPTFMRGRSLNNTFVILDEAQSLTRHEIKTIATRLGENSKLVITGDLQQIDNPRVSSSDNGLAIIVEAFKGTEWAVCLDLIKGERSDFSAAAAELL